MADPDELFRLVADGLLAGHRRIGAIPDERARADMERRLTAVSNVAKHDLATAWRRLAVLLAGLDVATDEATDVATDVATDGEHSANGVHPGGEDRPGTGKNAAG